MGADSESRPPIRWSTDRILLWSVNLPRTVGRGLPAAADEINNHTFVNWRRQVTPPKPIISKSYRAYRR